MSSAREIRTKISSVKNTQKITKAMQMVAASKMRKAQDQMQASRPYAQKLMQVIHHLSGAHPEYRHIFFDKREEKRVGYIVISTNRGLCGGLNTNVFKATLHELQNCEESGIEPELCLIGAKAESFFGRFPLNVVAKTAFAEDDIGVQSIIGAVKVMIDAFTEKRIDALYVCFNEFVNTMSQKATVEKMLPIAPMDESVGKHHWDYLYEPDARDLLSRFLTRYIETVVYQSCVENFACEQAARMVSMKSATENAGKLIDDLQLVYNKARQATITNEIAEIVNGAQAIANE